VPLSFDPGWQTFSSFLFGSTITVPTAPAGDEGDQLVWWVIVDHATVEVSAGRQLASGSPVGTFDLLRTVHLADATLFVLTAERAAGVDSLDLTLSLAPSEAYAYYAGNWPPGTSEVAADTALSGLGPTIVPSTGSSPYAAAVWRAGSVGDAPTLVPQTAGPYDDIRFTSTPNLSMRVTAYEPVSPDPSFEVSSASGDLVYFHAIASGRRPRWWAGVGGWS
jgi:hypothetical protein